MAGEIGQGVFGGAVSGAAAGAPLGPWGMAAGGLIGGISGAIQGSNAKKLNSLYEQAEANVKTTDPMQMAFLQRLRQQERNYRAGTDASSAFAASQARNVAAQTQANLYRAGGVGAVNNLLRSQAVGNQAMAQIGANASQGANQMLGLQGGIIDQITARNLQRQRELRNQAMERSVSARQNLQNMFSGALAMVPGIAGQMGGGMGMAGKSAMPMAGQQYNPGGMVGSTYVPGTTTGVQYNGMGTGIPQPQPNYGFNY